MTPVVACVKRSSETSETPPRQDHVGVYGEFTVSQDCITYASLSVIRTGSTSRLRPDKNEPTVLINNTCTCN
jgi:hypothetical protein